MQSSSHTDGQTFDAAHYNDLRTDVLTAAAGFFNVKDPAYGAVGDDTNDDTAEINACLAAAPEGAHIIFPPGTYKVSSALLPQAGQRLVGAGRRVQGAGMTGGTVLHNAGTGWTMNLSNLYGCTVEGFDFQWNSGALGGIVMTDTTGTGRHVLDRLEFVGNAVGSGTGIQMDGEVACNCHNTITDCEFRTLGTGIKLSGYANGNYFQQLAFALCSIGLDLSEMGTDTIGGHDNLFDRIEFDGTTTLAMKLHDAKRNVFNKVTCDGTTGDLEIDNGGGGSEDNIFIGCKFNNAIIDEGNDDHFIGCVDSATAPFNRMRRTKHEFIKAQEFTLRTGSPALNPSGANTRYTSWAFDGAGATECILTDFLMPVGHYSGNWTVKLYWTNLGAGSGDVVWTIRMGPFAAAADLNATTNEVLSTSAYTAPAQNVLMITTHSIAVAGSSTSLFNLFLQRESGHVADTLANDAGLVGVEIAYTADWL